MNLEQTMQYIAEADENTLFILWTNADPVTATKMVFMYAENSIRYQKWDRISIIIWGATARLTAENMDVQYKIRMLQNMGVHFTACITCAEELAVKEILEEMGIDLIRWLDPLTALIKEKKQLIVI